MSEVIKIHPLETKDVLIYVLHIMTAGNVKFNSLRAKFSRGNINIYLHLRSLLHIDTPQVVEILAHVGQGTTYAT